MFKNILTASFFVACAVAGYNAPALAKSEIQVTRTIYELSDFPALEAKAKEVCKGKATLSDKLKRACQSEQFPSVTKAGLFRNSGIGAELNTLIRQSN